MELKDLIGQKIVDISDDYGELRIKTEKSVYCLNFITYPDGTISETDITDYGEDTNMHLKW